MLIEILTKYYGIDILAMLLTFTGLYLIGNKKRQGFIIALIGNLTWVGLGLFVQSFGLIFANIVIVILYIRAYIKWSSENNTSKR